MHMVCSWQLLTTVYLALESELLLPAPDTRNSFIQPIVLANCIQKLFPNIRQIVQQYQSLQYLMQKTPKSLNTYCSVWGNLNTDIGLGNESWYSSIFVPF